MSAHRFRLTLSIASLLVLLAPMSAKAWWNEQWNFRKEIRLDTAAAGISGPVQDVPVLLRLSLANFPYFGDTKPDGSDLRLLAADDKTPLVFHIERYDPVAQMAFIWVRLPSLPASAGDKPRIFLYYGNPDAPSQADPPGTYDARQSLVYHFGPPAGSPQDSTARKTEPSAFQVEQIDAALIGSGARFNGTQSITIPASDVVQLTPDRGLTISAWMRVASGQREARVFTLGTVGGGELAAGVRDGRLWAALTGVSEPARVESAAPLAPETWAHVAVRIGDGRLSLLVDGRESSSTALATVPTVAGTLVVGTTLGGEQGFVGEIDELQVAQAPRSDDWLRALVASTGMTASLVQYGGDAQRDGAGGGEGYLATTLRNLTIDGWVVIVLCTGMLIAAIGIMASKFVFLNRVVKGNTQFLNEFRKLKGDPSELDRAGNGGGSPEEDDSAFETGAESQLVSAVAGKGRFGVSTLYRLYHHGVRETVRRLEGQAAGADRVRTLSPQSIEAIRATMDASLTRMTQRLSSQMVWLTIAIAGGPFLGLLGTVIGVMITFAAIAQAGDVNVNAIAPGIAAALAATVAGLAVAIPCLFGYNYLNTRIKEIVADMRVFVDEFVTRIAEAYS